MLIAGYPGAQSLSGAVSSSGAMQPGHNLHPVSNQQHAIQQPQYTHSYTVEQVVPSPPQTYSRTPSPLPPAGTSVQHTLAYTPSPNGPNTQQILFNQLYWSWPMNGPMQPEAMQAYRQNPANPMPDLHAMQAELARVNSNIANGMYNLPNPSIASPSDIVSQWSDNVDVSQTPWIKADARHGAPLPIPAPLMVAPQGGSGTGWGQYMGWM